MSNKTNQHADDFAQLVAEQHVQLRSFIRTLGVKPDWVDDLAQDTFLVAHRELGSFERERDFGKWLRGIARNLIRNEVRKDARRRRLLSENLTNILLNSDNEVEEPTLLEESRMCALRDCVEQLPSKSRELVSGRYGDGWTASDMADQVGMTAAAIRQALVRVRRQLKQCIESRTAEVEL
ncbi:MAG: sigma-70 family RNA polymerase sigma factor [Pirellulales bacterium]|jgi:RNA polymerase sigma-70 factor (ECF subfamily)